MRQPSDTARCPRRHCHKVLRLARVCGQRSSTTLKQMPHNHHDRLERVTPKRRRPRWELIHQSMIINCTGQDPILDSPAAKITSIRSMSCMTQTALRVTEHVATLPDAGNRAAHSLKTPPGCTVAHMPTQIQKHNHCYRLIVDTKLARPKLQASIPLRNNFQPQLWPPPAALRQ